MQEQSDSQIPERKSPSLMYAHPEVDPIIDRLFPEQGDNQSVRHVLKAIVYKEQLKNLQAVRDHEKGARTCPRDYFAWHNHEFYLRLLSPPEYFHRMTMLVENGVLNKSDFTSPRGLHPIYQMSNRKWLEGYSLLPITIPRVQKKIDNYQRWRGAHCAPLDVRMREHIITNFPYIGLSKQEFFRLLENRYHSRYLKTKLHPMPLDQYMECGEISWGIIDSWNRTSDFDKHNPDWIHSCGFGNRLHHPFTYLFSDIRPYILDKRGTPYNFIEYDLANCQPALFANLLVTKDKDYRNSCLVQLIERCQIYEDLAEKLGVDRAIAKTEFLHLLYCRAGSSAQREFERLYGNPAIEARRLKSMEQDEDGVEIKAKKRHAQLPKLMQRMESTMFREVWQELLARGFIFLPVHDAVYVSGLNRESKSEILALLKWKLKQHMRIRFKIKVQCIRREML